MGDALPIASAVLGPTPRLSGISHPAMRCAPLAATLTRIARVRFSALDFRVAMSLAADFRRARDSFVRTVGGTLFGCPLRSRTP